MTNIMIDLETLDTKSSAVVVAVGLVKFNKIGLGEYLKIKLSPSAIDSQLKKGRTIAGDTLFWWLSQNTEAKEAAFATNGGVSIEKALQEIVCFMTAPFNELKVWGNGAEFDNAILASLYASYNQKVPWSVHASRCYRTIKNINKIAMEERTTVLHDALADAQWQAKHLIEIAKFYKFEL